MHFQFSDFELDEGRRLLLRRGQPVEIGQLVFDLLLYLIRNRDRVVRKAELQEEIWQGRAIAASTIPTAINSLRTALGDSADNPTTIQAVYGKGYRWLVNVREADSDHQNIELRTESQGFVGRRTELSQLTSVIDLDLGMTGVALVLGEAGIGKTRLIEEFALRARRRGCRVAVGRCSEARRGAPYTPWQQVFRSLGLADRWESELSAMQSRQAKAASSASMILFDAFESIGQALSDLAVDSPVLVAIDDLQVGDPSSIVLFEALARELRPAGVRLVASFRSHELERMPAQLAAKIQRLSPVNTVALHGLTRGEGISLLGGLGCEGFDEDTVDQLMARTAGNPFALEQFAHEMKMAGMRSVPVGWVAPGVEAMLEARLDRLRAETRDVLQAAAVVGQEPNVGVLSRLLGREPAEVLPELEEGVGAAILRQVGPLEFVFAHGLLRDVLYSSLSAEERSRAHLGVVSALRDIHGVFVGEVACLAAPHGLAAGRLDDTDGWLKTLEEAAEWSARNLGFPEAVEYLQESVDLLDRAGPADPMLRADLLIRLGTAQRRAGLPREAERSCKRAAELARACGDPETLARAALGYAPDFFAIEAGVVDEFLIEALEEVRSLGARVPLELQAKVCGQLAIALYWSVRHDECVGLAQEALDKAAVAGSPESQVFAATAREVACWGPGGASERAALASWAIAHAVDNEDREMELVYRLYRLTGLLQVGEFEAAEVEVAEFSRKAAASLNPSALWYRDLFSAMQAMTEGRWGDAEECAARFEERGRELNDRNAENSAVIHRLYREIEIGSLAEGVAIAERQALLYPRLRAYECARIHFLAGAGRREEAKAALAKIVSPSAVRLPQTAEWLISVALIVEPCVLLGDKRRSEVLFDALFPYEDQYLVVVYSVAVWRPVNYYLARLAMTAGKYERSEELFEKALSQAEAAEAPPWVAHIELGYAELLRKRAGPGDGRKAREMALRSEEKAKALGMKPLLGRAREFLWGSRATA